MTGENTVEDSILENIDASEGVSNEATSQEGSSSEDTATQQSGEGTQQAQPGDSGASQQQQTTQQTEGPQQSQGQEGAATQKRIYRSGRFLTDDQGNVVDSGGNVIAATGKERRWFEQANRLQGQADQVAQQMEQLRSENAELRAANGAAQQLGLNNQETLAALNLMHQFKTNPQEAVKYILTQAQAKGYNIEGVTGQGLDMASVRQMINEAVGPLTQQQQTNQQEDRINADALQQYNDFISNPEYPGAGLHQDDIARLLQHDPQLSLEAAYWRLREWATRHQLDWNQPLAPQVAALQQQQAGNQQQQQSQQNGSPPISGGTESGGANQQQIQTPQPKFAHPDASFDSIVRESMQEAGMTV